MNFLTILAYIIIPILVVVGLLTALIAFPAIIPAIGFTFFGSIISGIMFWISCKYDRAKKTGKCPVEPSKEPTEE